MEGEWKVSDKEVYETWKPSDANILIGEAYTVKENGSKKIAERLAIRKVKKDIVYSAMVPNQNAGKAIDFVLNQIDENTYSFENPNHDFPKKIIYKKVSDSELFVVVQGKDVTEAFNYTLLKQTN
ncbi:hypothetical protein CA2559_01990 [Croceibacter atlanticus HTCC2559]|uniref:DUF6265 domain-containing protein n=2 Tax=Croceibacter TaxID=216431 RepID=A3U5H0_CROAH|nr:hypothetical protein CA2559_01990 [Croceibacter atlanticus HTCC2559]